MHAEWRRVEAIVESALTVAPARWAAFLEEACGGDQELRLEVESLLAYEGRLGAFMCAPVLDIFGDAEAEAPRYREGHAVGPYEIVALIGRGGMGEVYRARDTRLDRDVALKFLPAGSANLGDALERFRREARAVSLLNHPNICTLYDVGEHAGQPFLVLELVEGESLKQRLSGGPLAPAEVISIASQVCDGLDAAHSKGLVHRDIKPSNIFVTPRGTVKILDFGLAKLRSAEDPALPVAPAGLTPSPEATITVLGLVIGSAGYMSPEQARGEVVDARSDVFSLGIVLYCLATGARPFEGETVELTVEAILNRQPVSPRERNPAVPAQFEKVILKALEKDCAARYQSAAELCAALERLRQTAPRRSRSARAAALATLLVMALAVAWFALTSSRRWPAPRVHSLTAFPGVEQFPVFSPDGRHVAFLWNGESQDQFDLYRIPVEGGDPERLTNDADPECHPAWSPDGRSIAFLRCWSGTSDSMRETMTEVWILDLAAGKKRRIGQIYSPEDPGKAQLGWTGDSRSLVLEDKLSIEGPYSLFLLTVDNGEKRRITELPPGIWGDRSPAVSPDGKMLAFARVSAAPRGAIYLIDLDSQGLAMSEPRRLTGDHDEIAGILWSGDSREIVYSAEKKGIRELWRIPARGGRAPSLVNLVSRIGVHLALSRQGQLAFSEGFTDDDIWRLDLPDRTDHAGRPLIASNRPDQNAQISPDGRRIAFDSGGRASEIWVADADGSRLRQLTTLGQAAGTPRWSPDGRNIAFDCGIGDNQDIYAVGASGGEPRRLTSESSQEAVPSWSRDGQWIYFASDRGGSWQIWKLPAAGGKAVQVTTGGGFGAFESAAGDRLYYAKTPGRPTRLWSVPVRGGKETEVLNDLSSWSAFSVAKGGVFFCSHSLNRYGLRVLFFDFQTAEVRTVREVNTRGGSSFAVAPDGQWMLFGAKAFRGGDLTLIENLP